MNAHAVIAQPVIYQSYPPKFWYAVIVAVGREYDAADAFRRLGFGIYWPHYTQQVFIRRGASPRRRAVRRALIPGYLFSPAGDVDSDAFWAAMQRIPGFLNIAEQSIGVLGRVTNAEIGRIRLVEADEDDARRDLGEVKVGHNFKPGQPVRFTDSMLAEWSGAKVEKLLPNGRISIHVRAVMGRTVPMEVGPHQIEAL